MPQKPIQDSEAMEIVRAWRECKNNAAEAARQLGFTRSKINRALRAARARGLIGPDPPKQAAKTAAPPSRARTLDDFRLQYDDSLKIPKQIESGIKKHLTENGAPAWLRDCEFRELCGVSVAKWRRYADEYRELQVRVGGDIIWGHPDIIEDMRRAVAR